MNWIGGNTLRLVYLLAVLFTLSSCVKDTTSVHEKNTSVASVDSSTDNVSNPDITLSTEQNVIQDPPEYVVKNEGGLSIEDAQTAYEMCVRALTDYYKAIWNGSDMELDTFIDNDNLKLYMQEKIQSQYNPTDKVKNIEIGAWEVEYTEGVDGGFLYLKLPVHIHKFVGGYGEDTEFLVRNINGKLVIVDWYTGAKDSYDFIVRGENLTINNPNSWNDSE